jgi:DNA invertase Pin-like site-specific DNA recombinase
MNRDTASKVNKVHLDKMAYVYIRQSSLYQVENHVEGRLRQYNLVEWAEQAGWPKERISIIDSDLGKSGASPNSRSGFGELIAAVGRGEAGIVVALEATRLARNSLDWHNLIYMCRWTGTLIADENSVYDPADSSDRMILGIRGQMSEMELENSIGRMIKARWNKARRGEYLIVPPAGYDVGEGERFILSRDETIRQAIATSFEKFDELGSGRQVFEWWRSSGLLFPVREIKKGHPVKWRKPSYTMFLRVLKNPIFSGAYAFGRMKSTKEFDPAKMTNRAKITKVAQEDWEVLIKENHPGYISWDKFIENQRRLRENVTMKSGENGRLGAIREGHALLQGLVRCGKCGRPMTVAYGGHKSDGARLGGRVFQYRCYGAKQSIGGGNCLVIGGKRIDLSVVEVFFEVARPASLAAIKEAIEHENGRQDSLSKYWSLQVEKAEYEAKRAQRQYESVEPENRLVVRTLEKTWEDRLSQLDEIRRKASSAVKVSRHLNDEEIARIEVLGSDLKKLWNAPNTGHADRKRLLRCLIEDVQLKTLDDQYEIKIIWKGGAVTMRSVPRVSGGHVNRTSEDDIELVRKLAVEFDDAQIARTLNKQGRRSGRGIPYTKESVVSMRGRYKILRGAQRAQDPRSGPFTADETARELGVAMSTIQRWLQDGLLVGKQIAAGAPWQITLDEETRARLTGGCAPEGWVGLTSAAQFLGVSKGQVAHLVHAGKIDAVRVQDGKRVVWKIDVNSYASRHRRELFDQIGNATL